MSAAIELRGLTKWYGRRRGILDVDLTVAPGEIFGFIGPNGAGKSTTIRILLGLLRASAGQATVLGQPVGVLGKAYRQEVGYLPAEARYYGDMTAGELARYAASFYPGRELASAAELADRLDLDLGARIESLSLGNRKKVGIVQALLHRPRLLILDEPTAGLDPLVQRRFFDLLHDCNAAGATVFFSSHVLSEVQQFCHRVAILAAGRVVAVESVQALRARALKRVTVEWRQEATPWVPEGGARDGRRVTFLWRDDVPRLLEELGQRAAGVADLEIEQPSLEEVFMHYYGARGE